MAKDTRTKRLKSMVSFMRKDTGEWDVQLQDSTFELFGLDPKKPLDHRRLLFLLDYILFSKGRVGAPKKRGEQWLGQLKADIANVNHGAKKKSVRETCRILIENKHKRFKGRYAGIPFEALRHMVRNDQVTAGR
jgi:hypothetical protein